MIEADIFERFLRMILRPEEVDEIVEEVEKKGGQIGLRDALDLLEPYPFAASLFRQAYASKMLVVVNSSDLYDWLNHKMNE